SSGWPRPFASSATLWTRPARRPSFVSLAAPSRHRTPPRRAAPISAMTNPTPGFLDFFILEASEYVEQLDGLLARAGTTTGPDTEVLIRHARALRGSATMARITTFADLAGALERVGRSLRQGMLPWSQAVPGPAASSADDLMVPIRS